MCAPPFISRGLAQRFERLSHFCGEERRLFPSGEMTSLGGPVVVNEFGIGPLRPAFRRLIDLVRKSAHANRDREASDVEETTSGRNLRGVPVEARRGDPGVGQPIERDVVEYVVPA